MQVTPKQHKALADVLHSLFCHLSHLDQCAYHYERDWTRGEHKCWLDNASKVLEATSIKVGTDGS